MRKETAIIKNRPVKTADESNPKRYSVKNKRQFQAFHDTERLLRVYRDAKLQLELRAEDAIEDFEWEYDISIEALLSGAEAVGMGLYGIKLEGQARSIKRTYETFKIIDKAITLLREKTKNGKMYYWILYYTYLSEHEPRTVNDKLKQINKHYSRIDREKYFRERGRAITALSSILWGFTSKQLIEILDRLLEGTELSEKHPDKLKKKERKLCAEN